MTSSPFLRPLSICLERRTSRNRFSYSESRQDTRRDSKSHTRPPPTLPRLGPGPRVPADRGGAVRHQARGVKGQTPSIQASSDRRSTVAPALAAPRAPPAPAGPGTRPAAGAWRARGAWAGRVGRPSHCAGCERTSGRSPVRPPAPSGAAPALNPARCSWSNAGGAVQEPDAAPAGDGGRGGSDLFADGRRALPRRPGPLPAPPPGRGPPLKPLSPQQSGGTRVKVGRQGP